MEILILGVGFIAGVVFMGFRELLEQQAKTILRLPSKLSTPKGEILLPDITPDNILDKLVKEQGAIGDNTPLS